MVELEVYFQDKTLLIISALYPDEKNEVVGDTFTKVQVDFLKDYFKKIIVISQTPLYPKILLPLKIHSSNITDYAKVEDYIYENVKVFYPRYPVLPLRSLEEYRGKRTYESIRDCIIKNNITFDLVHSHFSYPSGYAGMRIARDYNKKHIVTLHEIHQTRIKELTANPLILETWANANALINVNHNTVRLLEELQNHNVLSPYADISYIPNMVDTKRFNHDIALKFIGKKILDKKILLSVGNLNQKKGFLELIDAINIIVRVRKDFKLFIIGDGPLKKRIQKKINDYGLEDYIILLGAKNNSALPRWFNICDVFILNSYVESFGVVSIEAMSCGKPVISTYNGGSETLIINRVNGYLIPSPEHTGKLAYAIITAMDRKWDADKIISSVEQYNTWNVGRLLLKKYKEVMECE
jgi:glycosyltransferase involved in cell wall biosynthesis